ncbi:hypothetical protein [Endozoicomonas sp. 4G]|uniref:hypothetical protein n=1 Tax=Endozoicomonas sp. 4G TaxID=2872754 RepID=UPI0020788FEC|nr:hypothetical protein [Endozoicomonas sp. 4G]
MNIAKQPGHDNNQHNQGGQANPCGERIDQFGRTAITFEQKIHTSAQTEQYGKKEKNNNHF